MLSKLTPEEATEIIVVISITFYTREAERLSKISDQIGPKNSWHEAWDKLKHAAEDEYEALTNFTDYIMAQLDGGDLKISDGLNL